MRYTSHYYSTTKSFTLVELLIVIGILAILTAAVVIVLNPAQLLKQARDSTRLSDLAALDNAIRNLQTQADISLGTASTVYVSIPDTSSTCANLSLPALPTGYTYHCVTADNLRNINGSGWIPIDFTLSPIQSIASLPIDPTNSTSSGLYYTYIPGGSFELTASLESAKYKLGGGSDKASTDGGRYTGLVEKGTNLSLLPIDYGDTSLVGYWTFDEGSGTTAYDRSGHNNNGTLINGPTWQSGSNCIKGGCLSFDGVDDYVDVGNGTSLNMTSALTLIAWINMRTTNDGAIIGKGPVVGSCPTSMAAYGITVYSNRIYYDVANTTTCTERSINFTSTNEWNFIAFVYDGTTLRSYLNTSLTNWSANNSSLKIVTNPLMIGGPRHPNGNIDEVRIYNRALSDAEIQAIYNATK